MKTGEDQRVAKEYEEETPATAWIKTKLHRKMAPMPKAEIDEDVTVETYVNHGRWVVECPFCPSAQLAFDEERRFYCTECFNAEVEHRWVTVVWPDEETRAAIEEALSKRPEPATRNWYTYETPQMLRAENRAHGIVDEEQ